jgi:guanylate kinase
MDIDVQGAGSMKGATDRAITIFILPPSLATLESRLRARASDREEDIQRRLANARAEIAQAAGFDYCVVNDALEDTIAQIRAIIQGERRRSCRQRIVCEGEGELDKIYPKP